MFSFSNDEIINSRIKDDKSTQKQTKFQKVGFNNSGSSNNPNNQAFSVLDYTIQIPTITGGSKFVLGKIDNQSLQEISKGNLNAIPIHLAYNTGNPYIDTENMKKYESVSKQEVQWRNLSPGIRQSVSDYLELASKYTYMGDPLTNGENDGLMGNKGVVTRKKLQEMADAIKGIDEKLYKDVINHSNNINALIKDSRLELGKRAGVPLAASLTEEEKLRQGFQSDYMTRVLSAEPVTVNGRQHYKVNTKELERIIDEYEQKNEEYYWDLRANDAGWWDNIWTPIIKTARELKKRTIEASKESDGFFETTAHNIGSLVAGTAEFGSELAMSGWNVLFDQSDSRPLQGILSQARLALSEAKSKQDENGYALIDFDDKSKTTADDMQEGAKMFTRNFLNTVQEHGLSIAAGRTIAGAGTTWAVAGATPMQKAIGFGLNVVGNLISFGNLLDGVDDALGLEKDGKKLTAMFGLETNTDNIALARTLFQQIPDDELEVYKQMNPSMAKRLDKYNKFAELIGKDDWLELPEAMGFAGQIGGDVATLFKARNTMPAYSSQLLTGSSKYAKAMDEILKGNWGWTNRLKNNPITSKLVEAGRLNRTVKALEALDNIFIVKPHQKNADKWFKALLRTSDDGIKTWATAEFLRMNPDATMNDIVFAGMNGMLFNASSFAFAKVADKLAMKYAKDSKQVEELLKIPDSIGKPLNKQEIIDQLAAKKAWQGKLLADLTLVNVFQGATSAAIEGALSDYNSIISAHGGMERVAQYFTTKEFMNDMIGGLILGANHFRAEARQVKLLEGQALKSITTNGQVSEFKEKINKESETILKDIQDEAMQAEIARKAREEAEKAKATNTTNSAESINGEPVSSLKNNSVSKIEAVVDKDFTFLDNDGTGDDISDNQITITLKTPEGIKDVTVYVSPIVDKDEGLAYRGNYDLIIDGKRVDEELSSEEIDAVIDAMEKYSIEKGYKVVPEQTDIGTPDPNAFNFNDELPNEIITNQDSIIPENDTENLGNELPDDVIQPKQVETEKLDIVDDVADDAPISETGEIDIMADKLVEENGRQKIEDSGREIKENLNLRVDDEIIAKAEALKKVGFDIEPYELDAMLKSNTEDEIILSIVQVLDRMATKYGIGDSKAINFIHELGAYTESLGSFGLKEIEVVDRTSAIEQMKKVVKAAITINLYNQDGLRSQQSINQTLDHESWHAFKVLVVDANPELSKMYEQATALLLENEVGREIFDSYYIRYFEQISRNLRLDGRLSEQDIEKEAKDIANQLATDEIHANAFSMLMATKDIEEENKFGQYTYLGNMYRNLIDKVVKIFDDSNGFNAKLLYSFLDTIKVYEHANSQWGKNTSFVMELDDPRANLQIKTNSLNIKRYHIDIPLNKDKAKDTLERTGLKGAAIEPKVIRAFAAPDTEALTSTVMAYFPNMFRDTSDIIHKRGTSWNSIESIKKDLATKISGNDLDEMAIQIYNKFDPSKFRTAKVIDLSIANINDVVEFDSKYYGLDNDQVEVSLVDGQEGQVGNSNHLGQNNNRQNITRYEPKPVGWINASNNIRNVISQAVENLSADNKDGLRSFVSSIFASDNIHSVKSTNSLENITTLNGDANEPYKARTAFELRDKRGRQIEAGSKYYTTYMKDEKGHWVKTDKLRPTNDPLVATHFSSQNWKLDVGKFSLMADKVILPLFKKGFVPTLASDKSIDMINIKGLLKQLADMGIAKLNDNDELDALYAEDFASYVQLLENSLVQAILGSEYMSKLGLNKEDYLIPYNNSLISILPLLELQHEQGVPKLYFLPNRDPNKDYEAENKFYEDNKEIVDSAIAKMNQIVGLIHETGVLYGSMNLSDYFNVFFKELNQDFTIDKPLFLSDIKIENDGKNGKPFSVSPELLKELNVPDKLHRFFNSTVLDVLNNLSSRKMIGLIDTLQQLALDPSGSMLFYAVQKENGDYKFNKYLHKYATYLKYDGSAPSKDTMVNILKAKGLMNGDEFHPEVAKYLYREIVNGEEQIFTDAYVFDPDSWLALADKLDIMSGVRESDVILGDIKPAAQKIYAMYSNAIREMVEFIMGEKALDAGTITLNNGVDNAFNIHHLLALFGGATPNGSLKTRAMIGNDKGHFPLKHAMHPEYMNDNDQLPVNAYGNKLMNVLFQFLKDSGVGTVVVPSALKGEGSYSYKDKEIDGVVYKIGAKGERVFRKEGQGINSKRVTLGQLSKTISVTDPITGENKEMQQPIPLTPQLAKETPFTVFMPEDLGLATPEALGAFLSSTDRITLVNGLKFNGGAKNSLKSQTMPIQLTGNTGLAWDSQKGDPHSLAGSAPFRMVSFSAVSKYMTNVPPELAPLMEELGLSHGGKANGNAILNEVATKQAIKIGHYINGFNTIASFLTSVTGQSQRGMLRNDDQNVLHLLKDLSDYIKSKESADITAWKNFKENSLEDRDDPNMQRKSNLVVEKELINSIASRIQIIDGIAKLTPDALGDIDLSKKITALAALSDNIFISNEFDEKSMFWRFLRTKGDTAFRMRGKGSISVLDSDRHAYEDTMRAIEYAKENGHAFNDIQSNIKYNVQDVFLDHPELSKIGDIDLYNQYLNTIFPKSKVQQIVYHGSIEKREELDPSFQKRNRFGSGVSFAANRSLVNQLLGDSVVMHHVLIDLQNPLTEIPHTRDAVESAVKQNNHDGVQIGNLEYTVPTTKQIHILGSKKDMAQFQKFVQDKNIYNIERNLMQQIDPKTGTYIDGSQGISISKDILELHNWKIGQKVFVILTPSDSIQSFSPMVITGLLADGKRNTMAFNKKLALELMGRDMDIDTLSIMSSNKDWMKRTENGEVDMFDMLHQIFTHNKIHEGSAKSALVRDKEKLQKNVTVKKTKLRGNINETSYPMQDDNIFRGTGSPMENTLTKDQSPILSPLNVEDVINSRKKFSAKPIGEFASLGNNIGQLLGKFKEGLEFKSKDIGIGKGLTFKLQYDETRHDYWFPYQKEGAVDIFQKHPYILDTNEWIAQFAVQGIIYDGHQADNLAELRNKMINDNEFGLVQAQITRVIGNLVSQEMSEGDPVQSVKKVGPASVGQGHFDKYSGQRSNYEYTDYDTSKGKTPSGKDLNYLKRYGYDVPTFDPFQTIGRANYRSIDDVMLESMFTANDEFTGNSYRIGTDFKAMKDELEWLGSREMINLRNELLGNLDIQKYKDPMTGLTFDINQLQKSLSDAFGLAYSILQVTMNSNNAFIQYPDLLNTFYNFGKHSPERIYGKDGNYETINSTVGLFTNKSANVIEQGFHTIAGIDYAVDGVIRPASLALLKAVVKTSIGDFTKLANKGKVFNKTADMRFEFTEKNPLFISMPIEVTNKKLTDEEKEQLIADNNVASGAIRNRLYPASANKTFVNTALWYRMGSNVYMGLPEGATEDSQRIPMMTIAQQKPGAARLEITTFPLSELFSGDYSTYGFHPKVFEALSGAVEVMMMTAKQGYAEKNKGAEITDKATLTKARLYYLQYASAALIDGLLAGGYGLNKPSTVDEGKVQGKEIFNQSKELRNHEADGAIGLRLFTVNDKQHFIDSMLVHLAMEMAHDLPLNADTLLSTNYYAKKMLDDNENISVDKSFAKNKFSYSSQDMRIAMDIHKTYAELIMGEILTSIPSVKGILGVMQFYNRKLVTENKVLFTKAAEQLKAQNIKYADVNNVKTALMEGMYASMGNANFVDALNKYVDDKEAGIEGNINGADVVSLANAIIKDIIDHPVEYTQIKQASENVPVNDKALSRGAVNLQEQNKINARKLVLKTYRDVQDVTENIRMQYVYGKETRIGRDRHLEQLGINKVFGMTEIGKSVYGHLRSLGYKPKVALNNSNIAMINNGKYQIPKSMDYLNFARQAINKVGYETTALGEGNDLIHPEQGTVAHSINDIKQFQLFDTPALTANFKKGSRNYIKSAINKGFNAAVRSGKYLHKDTGSYSTFKTDFNNFVKAHNFEDGEQMSFDNIFGTTARLKNPNDRLLINKAIREFVINKMADVAGIPPLEKSKLFTYWTGLEPIEKIKPEEYMNDLTYRMLKRMSDRLSMTMESFDYNELHTLIPYMNKFLTDVYSMYKIAKNAKKANDRFIKNLNMSGNYDEDSVRKMLEEANIFEMNTPLALAQKFSTQLVIENSNDLIIEWGGTSVNENGQLSNNGKPTSIRVSTINKGAILPIVPGQENGTVQVPQIVSPAEKILTVQKELGNVVRNQRKVAETNLEALDALTADKLSPTYDNDVQKAVDLFAYEANQIFSDVNISYEMYDGKPHAVLEFNGIKGGITGNGNFDNLFNAIKQHVQNYNEGTLKARSKELGLDSILDIALKKFLMTKLYNAQNAVVASEHLEVIQGFIRYLDDENLSSALAHNLAGYLQDLELIIEGGQDKQYMPRHSVSIAQEINNITNIMNPLFQELATNPTYSELSANGKELLAAYGYALGFKKVNENNYDRLVDAIFSHYNELLARIDENKESMDNDALDAMLKFGSLLNNNLSSRLSRQAIYHQGTKRNSEITGIANADSLGQYNNMIYERFEKAMGEVMPFVYDMWRMETKSRTGIDENPFIVDEVLYSISNLNKNRLIYSDELDILDGQINSKLDIGTAVQLEWTEDERYRLTEGLYLGNNGKYNVLYSNGKLVFVPQNKIASGKKGKTSTQLDAEILETMGNIFRNGIGTEFLDKASETYELSNSVFALRSLSPKEKFEAFKALSIKREEQNKYLRDLMASSGSSFKLKELLAHSPSYEIHLGYLGGAKVVQAGIGIAGGLISGLMGSPNAVGLFGWGLKGAGQFGGNVVTRILQNVTSNARTLFELGGFNVATQSIGNIFNERENAVVRKLVQKTETFTESELDNQRIVNKLSGKEVKQTIEILNLANAELLSVAEDKNYSLDELERKIHSGQISTGDILALVSTAKQNLRRKLLAGKNQDGISLDIINAIESLKYNPATKEFMTTYGYDIAALMQMRRNVWENVMDGLEHITKYIPLSEEVTRQMAYKAILDFMVNRNYSDVYTDEEIGAIAQNILNISGGQYGKSTRTRFGNSPLGRSMTMYGRFNKNNSVYYLNHVWDKIDNQLLLEEAASERPDLYEVTPEGVEMIGAFNLDKGKVTNSTVRDFNYVSAVKRKIALGMAVQATSLATRVGLKILGMSLLGGTFLEIMDELFGEEKDGSLPTQIEDNIALSGIMGDAMQVATAMAALSVFREGDVLRSKTLSKKQFEKYWLDQIKSPQNFAFGTGIGSGYSSAIGAIGGMGLNIFGWLTRDQFSDMKAYEDNTYKASMSGLMDMLFSKAPVFSPIYTIGMTGVQGLQIHKVGADKVNGKREVIKSLLFNK